jgi:hypothetical protein
MGITLASLPNALGFQASTHPHHIWGRKAKSRSRDVRGSGFLNVMCADSLATRRPLSSELDHQLLNADTTIFNGTNCSLLKRDAIHLRGEAFSGVVLPFVRWRSGDGRATHEGQLFAIRDASGALMNACFRRTPGLPGGPCTPAMPPVPAVRSAVASRPLTTSRPPQTPLASRVRLDRRRAGRERLTKRSRMDLVPPRAPGLRHACRRQPAGNVGHPLRPLGRRGA